MFFYTTSNKKFGFFLLFTENDKNKNYFGKWIKQHILKSVDEFCQTSNQVNKPVRVVSASKRFAVARHLNSNHECASI